MTDNYDDLKLTKLRKLSRGKFSGGYSMKKPELIEALRAWDIQAEKEYDVKPYVPHADTPTNSGKKPGLIKRGLESLRKQLQTDVANGRPNRRQRRAHLGKPPARFARHRLAVGGWMADPFQWKATQVPASTRRSNNRRRNKLARASRRANS